MGATGQCLARAHTEQGIVSLNYGLFTAIALDPIEKKPLFHFYPGTKILSVGSFGCNLNCPFCQNWQIARNQQVQLRELSPEQLVELALAVEKQGSIGVAFTYNEPLIGIEYLQDTLPLLKEAGQKTVLVTNGMINKPYLESIVGWVDAVNLDIKSFSPDFYSTVVGGKLETVLENGICFKENSVHLEITTLLIPGLTDDLEQIEELARWINTALGSETPLHLSRYFPNYQLDKPPTSLDRLKEGVDLARRYLKHVYAGNAPELGEKYTKYKFNG